MVGLWNAIDFRQLIIDEDATQITIIKTNANPSMLEQKRKLVCCDAFSGDLRVGQSPSPREIESKEPIPRPKVPKSPLVRPI